MGEYLPDDLRIFDAGDDLHGSAAGLASPDIDVEHALEALRPGHDDMAFGGCSFCKSIGSIGIASDLSPDIRAMTTMRFPANLAQRRSLNEEALHRRTDH